MSETVGRWTATLDAVDPAGSRHQGRRSAVVLTEETAVVGTADGAVLGFDRSTGDDLWRTDGTDEGNIVSSIAFDGGVAVGARGPAGRISLLDEGTVRWQYDTSSDIGDPQRETRFFLPFVVDLVTDGDRLYAAARRYERRGEANDRRHFESIVYAFEPDGTIAWQFGTDSSPISLATDGSRVAVAYNRCPGEQQDGLVILDGATGTERLRWDPGTAGQRRVGDVSLVEDGAVVTCHGDYRGYRLHHDGRIRWTADLATPREVDSETVYAYPNHVHATPAGIVFVTGNTYPEDGRETASRHPDEHTAFGYSSDGTRRWRTSVDGFANGIGADGETVAVPCAQNFRERDPEGHGVTVFAVASGRHNRVDTDGVVTAVAVDDAGIAAIEEPVVYHDEGIERGGYRLHAVRP